MPVSRFATPTRPTEMTKKTTYTRHPAILTLNGKVLHVDKIAPITFSRMPCSADEYEHAGMPATAYVTKTVEISAEEFDELLARGDRFAYPFLEGEGGHFGSGPVADSLLCVEVKSPNGTLLVDPEQGGPYWFIADLN